MEPIITDITKKIEHLAAGNRIFYRIASLYYKKIIKKEIELAKISDTDKVLCIGGGSCPFSGILLHEYTGAHVTIIDNDACCVRCSRDVVENLGYENAIKVLHSDGKEFSPDEYSVIHMAVQVSPLAQVFSQLEKGCKLGAKILVRLPKKSLSGLYGIGDESFLVNFGRKSFHSGMRNVESTALYIKTGGKNEKSGNVSGNCRFHGIAATI